MIDIPVSDIECWNRYPKHHWVYDTSKVLDAQQVKWSPFKTSELSYPMVNMNLDNMFSLIDCNNLPGVIYIKEPFGNKVYTDVFITKGEIKLFRTNDSCNQPMGETELRISAFVSIYFSKFSGVVCFETIQNTIYSISLKPLNRQFNNSESEKLVKKIYKKTEDILQKDIAS